MPAYNEEESIAGTLESLLALDYPADRREIVVMSVDEYETIRLIDLMEYTQEECAAQMDVARSTVQAIYGSARAKLAECVVEGKDIILVLENRF